MIGFNIFMFQLYHKYKVYIMRCFIYLKKHVADRQ